MMDGERAVGIQWPYPGTGVSSLAWCTHFPSPAASRSRSWELLRWKNSPAPARPSPHNLSLLRPKRARLRQREGALRSPAAAVSPYTITSLLQASALMFLSPSCPTTRTSRIPVEAHVLTERTAIPRRNARFVLSRDTHPDVDSRFNKGTDKADVDGTIAHLRRRHRSVSGSTICARHDGALGIMSVGKPCHRGRLRRMSYL